MNEKKILIFEDEWNTIKGSFELANIYAFESKLSFVNKTKSQDITYDSWRELYDAVFVDITLAKNTKWDGFNIIKVIHDTNLFPLNKVVVLTGNSKVEEKLNEMGINKDLVKILYKPINFEILAKELHRVLNVV